MATKKISAFDLDTPELTDVIPLVRASEPDATANKKATLESVKTLLGVYREEEVLFLDADIKALFSNSPIDVVPGIPGYALYAVEVNWVFSPYFADYANFSQLFSNFEFPEGNAPDSAGSDILTSGRAVIERIAGAMATFYDFDNVDPATLDGQPLRLIFNNPIQTGAIAGIAPTGAAPADGSATIQSNNATSNSGVGVDASFALSWTGGVYSIDSIVTRGQNFTPGDVLVFEGTQFGGLSPDNDLTLTVGTVGTVGGNLNGGDNKNRVYMRIVYRAVRVV